MSILAILSSYRGRINRSEFWLKGVLAWYGLMFCLFVMLIAPGSLAFFTSELPSISTVTRINFNMAILTCLVLMPYTWYAVLVKRCHDLGKSGWLSLLALIPIAGFIFFLWCGLAKGETFDNKHGPIPS